MIEKMKFLSMTGPKADIDRVVNQYLAKYEIHLENAMAQLSQVQNLSPYIQINPYKELLEQAEEFAGLLEHTDKIPLRNLSLEEAASNLDDEFMKKGIMLIVDGTDPELVRGILETDLDSIDARHKLRSGFWDTLGAMGPAWGMIGTLVGLVCMLYNMSDPSSIGPKMGVALITTFYGSMLANWICAPVANKLKADNATEMMLKEVMIEGLLSIQAGENPRVIEEKLKSFLSPANRSQIGGDNAGGEE